MKPTTRTSVKTHMVRLVACPDMFARYHGGAWCSTEVHDTANATHQRPKEPHH